MRHKLGIETSANRPGETLLMSMNRRHLALAVALAAAAWCDAAVAQGAWPQNTVKIVVPYPPGATADGLPRILLDELSAAWKVPVIIETKAGAGGNVGAEFAARAAPDGYTLLHTPTPVLAINQYVYKKMSFDSATFKPIMTVAAAPSVMSSSTKLGAANVKELIEKAKAAPGSISYASQGNGSTSHVTGALFEHQAGVKLTHVPYRGSAPAMTDLVGGHVGLLFDNLFSSLSQHKAGTIRILAVCTPQRLPQAPEIPTMSESGLPDFVSIAYFGFVAPPGTPDAIVEKINGAIADALKKPDVRERIEKLGATIVGGTPAEMGKLLDGERAKWSAAVRNANIPQVE